VNRRRWFGGAGTVLVAVLSLPLGPVTDAGARDRQVARHSQVNLVRMHVDSVSPSTPQPTTERQPLKITLTLTNTTGKEMTDVQIIGERGAPIGNQGQLDEAIANPVPSSAGLPVPAHPAVTVPTLLPGVPTTVEFDTTTSTLDDGSGVCICADAGQPLIYPLIFSAHTEVDGVDTLRGLTVTFLPIFYAEPQPLRVSWVWPLLEPPHRFIGETVFTDDDLAASVAGGRLSRALAVVEAVGDRIPLTLVIDPELLDEVEVMATEPYTVQTSDGSTTAGVGQVGAQAWLDRLSAVLREDPGITVQLTPYADPDVETLTQRGLSWSTAMPTTMSPRVSSALAGRSSLSTISWPVLGTVSRETLRRLAGDGVNTILLKASALRVAGSNGPAPGLAHIDSSTQPAAALLMPAIQKYAARAITSGGDGTGALPTLMAELAVRVAEQPDVEQALTIAPPRYVDPDVTTAVQTIEDTSSSIFATPIALGDAVADSRLMGSAIDRLAPVQASVIGQVPAPFIAAVAAVPGLRTIRALLDTDGDAQAAALVDGLPAAVQRAESSAWRNPSNADAASAYAQQLGAEIERITTGVRIVKPSSGTYTLASNNSPLPITIANDLPYAVRVNINIVTVQTSGFKTDPVGVQKIEANATRTIHVPATSVRSGLIRIEVLLQAPCKDCPLGLAVQMRVRSTALGIIGVIITIVAGTVLGIALLWRIFRRVRNRGTAGRPPAEQATIPAPEPVA
jgi:hypothetical protein